MSVWDKKEIESSSLYAEVRAITGDEQRNITSAINNAIYSGHIKPKKKRGGRDYIDTESFMRWAKSRRAEKWIGKFDGVEGFSTLVHLSGLAARGEIGNVSSTAVPKSLKECAKMILEQAEEIKDLREEINTLRNETEKMRITSEKQRKYAKKRHQNINL